MVLFHLSLPSVSMMETQSLSNRSSSGTTYGDPQTQKRATPALRTPGKAAQPWSTHILSAPDCGYSGVPLFYFLVCHYCNHYIPGCHLGTLSPTASPRQREHGQESHLKASLWCQGFLLPQSKTQLSFSPEHWRYPGARLLFCRATPPPSKGNPKPAAKLRCPRMARLNEVADWELWLRGEINGSDWGGEKRKGRASWATELLCEAFHGAEQQPRGSAVLPFWFPIPHSGGCKVKTLPSSPKKNGVRCDHLSPRWSRDTHPSKHRND